MSFIQSLLKDKIPDSGELEIFFFEECNLRCVHCFQDHLSRVGQSRDEILSKLEVIKDFFIMNPKQHFIMNIMGGELFQDKLLDKFLPVYSEFIEGVNKLCQEHNKSVTFNFVTSLVFKNTQPVLDWVKHHNLKFSVSYDITGRFNLTDFETYKQNIELFNDYVGLICLVATKQNMAKLIETGDKYYDYLYSKFPCYWDQLTPGPTVPSRLVPTESELYKFNIFLIDNYPKCTNLDAFTNGKSHNKMSCPSINKLLIEANNRTASCRIHQHEDSKDFITIVTPETNDPIIQKFLDDHDCMSCEYFQRCPFSCFVRNDWLRLGRDFDGCVYKETFRYIDSKDGTDNKTN